MHPYFAIDAPRVFVLFFLLLKCFCLAAHVSGELLDFALCLADGMCCRWVHL